MGVTTNLRLTMGQSKLDQYSTLTANEYSDTFSTFLNKATQQDDMGKFIQPIIDRYGSRPVKVMCVGAGAGWREDILVKQCGLSMSFYYAIEPNPSHCEKLKDVVTSWDVEYIIDQNCFTTETKIAQTFDLILMPHVLCSIKDPFHALLKAKSYLNPGGSLIILQGAAKGVAELCSYLNENVSLYPDPIANHGFIDDDLIENLTKSGIAFNIQKENVVSTVDLDDFVRSQGRGNANDVISFFLQTRYENLSNQLKANILQKTKDHCFKGSDGKYTMLIPTTMIQIPN